MTLYERKPPVVDAEQWDGTLDGFEIVKELFDKASPNVEYQVIVTWASKIESYSRINFRQASYDREWQDCRPQDWIILNESGRIEWLDPQSFNKVYKEINDEQRHT